MDVQRKLAILSLIRDIQQDAAQGENEELLQMEAYFNAAGNTSTRDAVLSWIGSVNRRAAHGERTSVREFATTTVPRYTPSEFRDHFRMSRLCYSVRNITT